MSSIHSSPSPLAGQTITVDFVGRNGGPRDYRVEDWWDRVAGGSWMYAKDNMAAMQYALRTGLSGVLIPTDDEVLYGHTTDGLGHLVHVSEIAADVNAAAGQAV